MHPHAKTRFLFHQLKPSKHKTFVYHFVQPQPSVFDVGPPLYKCYTNALCLLKMIRFSLGECADDSGAARIGMIQEDKYKGCDPDNGVPLLCSVTSLCFVRLRRFYPVFMSLVDNLCINCAHNNAVNSIPAPKTTIRHSSKRIKQKLLG